MPARTEPEPAIPDPPRYAPARPFPKYRFVPGLNPHPVSDPRGHSYRGGEPEPKPPRLDPARWRESEDYLHGCDLYNHAYYWEAHEAWEGLWHLTNKGGPEGLFLQGLIQLSASHLKRHMGEETGSEKLARLGLEKLRVVERSVAPGTSYLGIELAPFLAAAQAYAVERTAGAPWPAIRLVW